MPAQLKFAKRSPPYFKGGSFSTSIREDIKYAFADFVLNLRLKTKKMSQVELLMKYMLSFMQGTPKGTIGATHL